MQPVPRVSRADVERVVARDFPATVRAEVFTLLNEYGTEKWEGARDRVHLAILKLADGNFDELPRHVAVAKQDFRDVIAAAEYPRAFMQPPQKVSVNTPERQQVYDADAEQYRRWLENR